MSDEILARYEETADITEEILHSPKSRGQFLKGAAVAAATLGIAPQSVSAMGLTRLSAKYSAESVQEIINIAATAETAAVTALYNLHLQVNASKLNLSGIAVPPATLVSVVRAALREEQDHLSFLMGAGAKPLYTSFTFPSIILTSAVEALKFLETAETAFIAAYIAANYQFARGGHFKLARYAFQIGGTEAEHRALARAALGQAPPNNKSFETNLYTKVSGAANTLAGLGIFKPGVAYPGAAAVDQLLSTSGDRRVNAGVIQRKP